MVEFLVYSLSDGSVIRSGTCQPSDLHGQATNAGEAVMEAPSSAIIVTEVSLNPIRETLYRKIDAQAEDFRAQFLTPGSGQAITYLRKETEARSFLADSSAPTPLLTAEAAAVGTSVEDLAQEVIANSDAWLVIGGKIEAARRGAKKTIELSDNVGEMHAASIIDWEAAVA